MMMEQVGMENEIEDYCNVNDWFDDQLPRAKIIDMVKRWIMESHDRARDIYDVFHFTYPNGQILGGTHSPTVEQIRRIQEVLKTSICRASYAMAEFLSIVVGGDVYEEPFDFLAMMEKNRHSYEIPLEFDDDFDIMEDDMMDYSYDPNDDDVSDKDFEW